MSYKLNLDDKETKSMPSASNKQSTTGITEYVTTIYFHINPGNEIVLLLISNKGSAHRCASACYTTQL
jgi:hypothetical protein